MKIEGGMDGELERLRRMYAELGEEHLLDLSKDREGLRGDAQMALSEELRRRGLEPKWERAARASESGAGFDGVVVEGEERADGFGVGVPGLFPGAGPAVEHALEPGGEERLGMVNLASFFDGLELSRACEALDDSDIEPAIEEIAGDATTGTATRFEVWVSVADLETSKVVLRRRMGLFPLAEVAEDDADDDGAGEPERVVAEFDTRAEAEHVRDILVHGGFSAMVTDVLRDGKLSVLVGTAEYDGAMELLTERLELD